MTDRDAARRKFYILVLLTFAAGFVDTAGFILLFELFTAHITGNVVIALADIVHRGGLGALTAFLMLPIFAVTVALLTILVDAAGARFERWVLAGMIGLETVMLVIFAFAAILLHPSHTSATAPVVILVGGLGVIAMAVQNTIAGVLPKHSTVMTGNASNLVIHTVRWLRARRLHSAALRKKSREQLRILWPTMLLFSLGGIVAAIGIVTIGNWCLLIPVPVVAAASVCALGVPLEGSLKFEEGVGVSNED
ncbi:MAG: YoaK family protein [Acetobacteraceae bacterium]